MLTNILSPSGLLLPQASFFPQSAVQASASVRDMFSTLETFTPNQGYQHLLQKYALCFQRKTFTSYLTGAPVSASGVICSCMLQHILTLAPMTRVSGNSDFICASMAHTNPNFSEILRYTLPTISQCGTVLQSISSFLSCSKFLRCA